MSIFSTKKNKSKIGLALGSGGAKGFAHLGALLAFEENKIEFDMVSGTSIGAIIGSMYAYGYSVTDICEMLKRVSITSLLSGVMVNMDMTKIIDFIGGVLGDYDFSELKKPFFAVATNSLNGEEVVLSKGNVARAVCASSAMQPFFRPVNIDNVSLVDGAYVNAVPSDVLKNNGAAYVVGVDLSAYKRDEPSGSSLLDIFMRPKENAREKGYTYSDIMITPSLENYRSTSISGADEMFEEGYQAAVEKIPEIIKDLEIKKLR